MGISSDEGNAALARLRSIAEALPEVSERLSHGTPTFFIREKKTLVSLWENHHGAEGVYLWCPAPPGAQAELVESEPERFFVPPYVGGRGWIGVRLENEPDWNEIAAIIEDAYRLVAPKTLVKLLSGQEG